MNWNDSATITPHGGGSFTADVDERWTSLKGSHGGIVAALMVEAVESVLDSEGVDVDTTLRSATLGYVSGNAIGGSTIDVEIIRRGRSMITTHARVTQNGATTTVARFHHSSPRPGLEYSDLEPMMPKPVDAIRLEVPGPAHLLNVEAYVHPDTTFFAGADRAEWIAWCRPIDGGTFDSSWLTMFGDYFPPAVFVRIDAPTPAVTIEYSIQIHDGAGQWTLGDDEYLMARMHTFHSHDGFAVEDGRIHLPDNRVLATVRQTRLAG